MFHVDRFKIVGDAELNELFTESTPKNTRNATKSHVKVKTIK
jgi:hypothetical protein